MPLCDIFPDISGFARGSGWERGLPARRGPKTRPGPRCPRSQASLPPGAWASCPRAVGRGNRGQGKASRSTSSSLTEIRTCLRMKLRFDPSPSWERRLPGSAAFLEPSPSFLEPSPSWERRLRLPGSVAFLGASPSWERRLPGSVAFLGASPSWERGSWCAFGPTRAGSPRSQKSHEPATPALPTRVSCAIRNPKPHCHADFPRMSEPDENRAQSVGFFCFREPRDSNPANTGRSADVRRGEVVRPPDPSSSRLRRAVTDLSDPGGAAGPMSPCEIIVPLRPPPSPSHVARALPSPPVTIKAKCTVS